MKLWQKGQGADQWIEDFTVGKDRELDAFLASFDVLGSMAHTTMLESIGLLEKEELPVLLKELKAIYQSIEKGEFKIEDGVEDVHSQVEMLLTERLGDLGKKIHSGRSRNDQVLVDLKLYMRDAIEDLVSQIEQLFDTLIQLSNQHKDVLIPGYTHLQVAMPSSMGLWFGAYAESLADDLHTLKAAYAIANKNPLGSAAGYGSSFPLNRTFTTTLLGFDGLNYNVVYAQMGRGKAEQITAQAMANVAQTLGRMAMDVCLYMNQNFGFLTFPDALTTGSSIMPHKRNPDVFEIIRGKCNKMKALPNEIAMILTNLPSGYHREMQLIKENFLPSFDDLNASLAIAQHMFENIIIKPSALGEEKYDLLFTVERVNELVVKDKLPFRDAYLKVKEEVNTGTFVADRTLAHTHEGSIGNLCNDEIKASFQQTMQSFGFERKNKAIQQLLASAE